MILAFEFDDSSLRAVVGTRPNRQFRVSGTIELPMEQDAEVLGQKLKEELQRLGVQRADAIAVLSRWQTEVREITVPPAPDDELPDLVRFQARNEFNSLTDDWRLDYIRLAQPTEGPHRVLAAAMDPAMLAQLQSICQAAGINLKHIVLQSLAIVDLFSGNSQEQNTQLLIRSSNDRADLSIAVEGELKITRSIRFAPDATPEKRAAMLISESRRTLAAARPILDEPIKHATVLGSEKRFKALSGNLTKGLGFSVDYVDGFEAVPLSAQFVRPDQTCEYAALLGSLVRQESSTKHAIDFLSPKRVVVRRPDQYRWLLIGGLALAGSILLFLFAWSSLGSQQKKIDDLTLRLSRISSSNEGDRDRNRPGVEQIMGEVGEIDKWKLNDVNWLDELKQLSDRMLLPDDVMVDSLNANAGREAPQLVLVNRVASDQKETELVNSLRNRPYQVKSDRSVEGDTDEDYALAFDLRASFEPVLETLVEQLNQQAIKFLQEEAQPVPAEAPN